MIGLFHYNFTVCASFTVKKPFYSVVLEGPMFIRLSQVTLKQVFRSFSSSFQKMACLAPAQTSLLMV